MEQQTAIAIAIAIANLIYVAYPEIITAEIYCSFDVLTAHL